MIAVIIHKYIHTYIHRFSSLRSVVTDLTSKTIGNSFQYRVILLSKTSATVIPWLLGYGSGTERFNIVMRWLIIPALHNKNAASAVLVQSVPFLPYHATQLITQISGVTGTPRSYRNLRTKRRKIGWGGLGLDGWIHITTSLFWNLSMIWHLRSNK